MNNIYSECFYTIQGVYICKKKDIVEKFRPRNRIRPIRDSNYYPTRKSYGSLSYRLEDVIKKFGRK